LCSNMLKSDVNLARSVDISSYSLWDMVTGSRFYPEDPLSAATCLFSSAEPLHKI
jgi:hypothetical protein